MKFFKKYLESKEYEILALKISSINKRIAMQEIDIALLTDRLTKAVTRKAIKKTEPEEEKEENKNPVLLPI